MKIYTTKSLRHEYIEVELCHPDYSSNYEYWFVECDYDEVDSFDELISEYIHKNVSSFWHNVTLKTKFIFDGKLYINKYTYSVPTGERVDVETEVYNLK